jgi:hypothetical protein
LNKCFSLWFGKAIEKVKKRQDKEKGEKLGYSLGIRRKIKVFHLWYNRYSTHEALEKED